MTKNPESWMNSFLVDYFQKQNPSIDVYGELKKASRKDSSVKKYLETIEEHKFAVYKPNKDKKEKYDYKYVKDRFDNTKLGIVGPRLCEKLSKKDLKKLADEFLKEKDRLKQAKYLGVLGMLSFLTIINQF